MLDTYLACCVSSAPLVTPLLSTKQQQLRMPHAPPMIVLPADAAYTPCWLHQPSFFKVRRTSPVCQGFSYLICEYCHVFCGSCLGANSPIDSHPVYSELRARRCCLQRSCIILLHITMIIFFVEFLWVLPVITESLDRHFDSSRHRFLQPYGRPRYLLQNHFSCGFGRSRTGAYWLCKRSCEHLRRHCQEA